VNEASASIIGFEGAGKSSDRVAGLVNQGMEKLQQFHQNGNLWLIR